MKDTLESLRHKIDRATELGSVVRSMKALSAAGIRQYEQAVTALEEYYRTVELGLWVCREELGTMFRRPPGQEARIGAVVFGSSQGLVGQFNDQIVQFARERLANLPGPKLTWAVGEIIRPRLADEGLPPARTFASPHSVQAITPLISQLLIAVEDALTMGTVNTVWLFFQRPLPAGGYQPEQQRFIPLDRIWLQDFEDMHWATENIPEVLFRPEQTVKSLVREYFFVTLFRACAESLASENASRLAAMQRAEKNIGELLDDLTLSYHQLRQDTIDEELFDLIAGAEAMGGGR